MLFKLTFFWIVLDVFGYIKKPLRKEYLLSGKNKGNYRSLKNV